MGFTGLTAFKEGVRLMWSVCVCVCVRKLGAPFLGPYIVVYSLCGSILGSPYFWKLPCGFGDLELCGLEDIDRYWRLALEVYSLGKEFEELGLSSRAIGSLSRCA